MFGFIGDIVEDVVDTVADIGTGLVNGELPTGKQVSKLIGSGMTVYEISDATGFAVETIKQIVKDSE